MSFDFIGVKDLFGVARSFKCDNCGYMFVHLR